MCTHKREKFLWECTIVLDAVGISESMNFYMPLFVFIKNVTTKVTVKLPDRRSRYFVHHKKSEREAERMEERPLRLIALRVASRGPPWDSFVNQIRNARRWIDGWMYDSGRRVGHGSIPTLCLLLIAGQPLSTAQSAGMRKKSFRHTSLNYGTRTHGFFLTMGMLPV